MADTARQDTARGRTVVERAILRRLQQVRGVVGPAEDGDDHDSGSALFDRGYEPLSVALLRGRRAVDEALSMAAFLAETLARLHAAGVVHRDINPSSILVADEGQGVVEPLLTGFDRATLTVEDPAQAAPSRPEGTTPYTAPEQSGRTGHAVDERSDLYALGAVLYELLAHRVPFAEADPLQQMHAHLVKAPVEPHQLNADVPPLLSRIVMRLLQKDPQRRYLSAAGLAADLRKLEQRLRSEGEADFELGAEDYPARLAAPPYLVGRESERRTLASALDEAMAGRGACLLVYGEAGVGKSALVNELRSMVAARHGWYVQGKFDQSGQNAVEAVQAALRSLGRRLLAQPEHRLARYRQRLEECLGANVGFGPALLPEFSLLLGPRERVMVDDPRRGEARTVQATVDLLRGIAEPQHPIVLVLDDVQWAPDIVLKLLVAMATAVPPIPGLLLVLTYRSTAGAVPDVLVAALEMIKAHKPAPWQVALTTLSSPASGALIAAMLRMPGADAFRLSQLLSEYANGNPYEIVQLVNVLWRDGLLTLHDGQWQWHAERIRSHLGVNGVAQLLVEHIARMPEDARDLLKTMACLGGAVGMTLLTQAVGASPDRVRQALQPGLDDGLLELDHDEEPVVRFRHDRIQQAILDSLPSPMRNETRLELARRLAPESAFASRAAEQYLAAVDAMLDRSGESEIRAVISLFHGEASRLRVLNFELVERYASTAIMLLGIVKRPGDDRLLVRLQTQRHAALYGLGRLAEMDPLYDAIVARSSDIETVGDVTCIQIGSLVGRRRHQDAATLGLEQLARLGHERPADLARSNRQGLQRWWSWILGESKSVDFDRRVDTSAQQEAASKIIVRMMPVSLGIDTALSTWLALEAHRIWTETGPNNHLTLAAASTGIFLVGEIEGGERLAYLGIRHVLDVAMARELEPGTSYAEFSLAFLAAHWMEPLEAVVKRLQATRNAALRNGDLLFATFAFRSADLLFDGAKTIDGSLREIEAALAFTKASGNRDGVARYLPRHQLIKSLLGETRGLADWNDASFDESHYVQENCGEATALAGTYFGVKAVGAALSGDWPEAAACGAKWRSVAVLMLGIYMSAVARIIHAIAQAIVVRQEPDEARRCALDRLRQTEFKWLKERADDAPMNFLHLQRWFQAELDWTQGDRSAAASAFELAMTDASSVQRPWHRALIIERAGRFHLECGLTTTGRMLIERACQAYAEWGARGKVTALREEFDFLPDLEAADDAAAKASHLSADAIDWMAVLKASQALSSETRLSRLTDRLVEVLGALTGATEVALLLRSDERPWLQASTLEPVGEADQPQSVLRYAERTQEVVDVEDAKDDDRFAADPYFASMAHCAMLVVPVFSQGALRALLVLQNRAVRRAFGARRLDAVKLIAGQLAVSLDNALLYATLEKKVADRTAELGEANRSLQRLIEQRESELRATGALKAALVDHAQEAIVITNEAGVIVEFNPAAQAMFGMPRDRMLGRGPEVLMPTRYGHLAPQVLQQLENGEIFGQRWALQGLRADGSEFPAEVVLWSVQVEGMLHYAASVRDVTEQRQNEQTLERQRADLRQSEKLTLMGSLLAGVAHELNNPLAVVMGRASLIEERCRGTDMQQEAHRIGEAAQRCGRIVKTFLNMARRREPVRAAVKLNDVVVGATDLLGYLLRTHQVEMVLDLGDSLPDVWGDADQLTQVVVNLIVNAQQAMESMPNGRRLRLSTGWQPGAHEQPSKVWLRASDSGPGVPAELAEKIFQPFFTTKSNGQGTGLGLAMSHSIAREHGGDLVLEASSAGASFCCWLPALSD